MHARNLVHLLPSLILLCLSPELGQAADVATVTAQAHETPISFAADEIQSALRAAGWFFGNSNSPAALTVVLAEPDGRGEPESFEISTESTGTAVQVRIRGSDVRGVMYGGLDVAEQIVLGDGKVRIEPRAGKPFLAVRSLKINVPLAGNAYLSAEDQAHGSWFWDLDYWRAFMRFLAFHRYNLLTFWNSHPFDQMVRITKYPEANGLPPDKLEANIAFFHQLFRLARDYGLDTSIVTWNIHTSAAFQKAHGIKDGQDSPLIRDYQQECIKALLHEYPELTGLGTCPGEAMGGTAEWREEWIAKTYFTGIAAAGRTNLPFIHRYWGSTPSATAAMLTQAKYPGPLLLDIKFNGEQMYSSPKSHLLDQDWLTQKPLPYKLLWHLRNDCIYQFRWGDLEFATAMVRNCGGPNSAGFVMGSEIEVPGLDRVHTPATIAHKTWKYEFQKNWTRFGMWGRAGYNPDEPPGYWISCLNKRLGPGAGAPAYEALASASKIVPLTTSFHWNYMNGDWYPEGNVGAWNTSFEMSFPNYRDNQLWHDVLEWTFNHVIDDSLQCIPDYVADQLTGVSAPASVLTPPRYSERLEEVISACEKAREQAAKQVTSSGKNEWECLEMDLRALENLGRYYAAKARAATEVMFFLATGEESRRNAALQHLQHALGFWKQLASNADRHYLAHEIWLYGKQFDWSRYLPEAERDLQIVRELSPWPRNDLVWRVAGGPDTISGRTWKTAAQLSSGLKPWVEIFNARASTNVSRGRVGKETQKTLSTELIFAEDGLGIVSLNSSQILSASINGVGAKLAGAAPVQSILGPVHMGGNSIELTFAEQVTVPVIRAQDVKAKDALFLEAEVGQLQPPFEVREMAGVSSRKIVVAPKGKGRGADEAGTLVDNGWVSYAIELPREGDYVVSLCAWWPDTSANSFYYTWDSKTPAMVGNDELFNTWHWVDSQPTRLGAGRHVLTIRNRDEGSIFDCLLVSAAENKSSSSMLDAYYERMAAPHHVRPNSLGEWKSHQIEVRKQVLRDIGLEPLPEKLPLAIHYGGVLDRGDYLLKRVYWQTWPEVYASGFLYLPKKPGKHPAILNPHGHLEQGTRDPQEQTRSIAFARKGYVSLAVDSVHLPSECFLTGATSIGVMTYNGIRGLDLLESLPEVDPARLGCNGMSGGGQQTLYLMAVDDRIAVASPVVIASWFRRIMDPGGFPHCICNVVPGILRDTDVPEMAATFAPKPLFFECVTGDWTRQFPKEEYPELESLYGLYDARSAIAVQQWNSGHDYNQPMRERAYAFFNRHLREVDSLGEAAEPEIKFESIDTLNELDKPPSGNRGSHGILDWYRSRHTFQVSLPKDKPAWEQYQKVTKTNLLELLGDVPATGRLVRERETAKLFGQRGREILVQSEPGIQVPVLLITPDGAQAESLVLLLHEGGRKAVLEEYTGLMESLLANRAAVALADVRLTGRLARPWSLDCILWGRPEVGMALTDLRAVLDVLRSTPGTDRARVALVGLGTCGPAVLFAAALESRVDSVAAPELGLTYRQGRTTPLIANMLQVGDLPQLVAMAAPHPVLLGSVEGGAFDFASSAYRDFNVEGKLHIKQTPVSSTELVDWVVRH